ncbi:hypothetical protein IFT98_02280 [Pseudomonas sp. CFBP 8770]|uniref:hypothetical protein n=1 Tax=unclassified Pseudomonas TaxID=196821 RepID=UPI0017800DC9|nr:MULTISPECIES: hypothetical protein [unclassified Pseudomonas]MBD8473090.1 hypothetical protein [Pseudomonas sp. CFBP 8773]MBD8645807.1 hypothetical protein [Pseudomonas sp. CFBP 8770]
MPPSDSRDISDVVFSLSSTKKKTIKWSQAFEGTSMQELGPVCPKTGGAEDTRVEALAGHASETSEDLEAPLVEWNYRKGAGKDGPAIVG